MPSEGERSDVELVEAFQAGDRDAFAELYRRHRDRVFRLALSVTCDREVAADVTQDAFLKVHGSIHGFEGRSRFTTWLHRIVVNTCHDAMRRRPQLSLEETGDVDSSSSAAVDVASRVTLVSALARLPEDFRVVVVLHDIYDHRYEEIATALGIPVGTVKSRLARGRLRLAGILGVSDSGAVSGNKADPRERPNQGGDE